MRRDVWRLGGIVAGIAVVLSAAHFASDAVGDVMRERDVAVAEAARLRAQRPPVVAQPTPSSSPRAPGESPDGRAADPAPPSAVAAPSTGDNSSPGGGRGDRSGGGGAAGPAPAPPADPPSSGGGSSGACSGAVLAVSLPPIASACLVNLRSQ